MTLQPLQPTLPLFPSEARRRLAVAERRLELQSAFIAQSQVLIDLTQQLNAIN